MMICEEIVYIYLTKIHIRFLPLKIFVYYMSAYLQLAYGLTIKYAISIQQEKGYHSKDTSCYLRPV